MILRLLPLILCIVLVACSRPERLTPHGGDPVTIDPTQPPSGMYLVQILLENQSLPLKGTGCEGSWSENDRRQLQHVLAVTFGFALDKPRTPPYQVTFLGGCEAERFELRSGKIIDGWRCNINVVDNNQKGEYVANSSIYFGITKDTWELIPETLLCM